MNRGRKEAKGGVSSTVKPEKELSLVLVTQTWPISETCQQLEDNFTKCNYCMKIYQSISGFLSIPFLRRVTWIRKRKQKILQNKHNSKSEMSTLNNAVWSFHDGREKNLKSLNYSPPLQIFFLLAEFEDTIAWFFNRNNFYLKNTSN